jgi:orotidine-5'-phosphate decarboxylase
MLMAVRDVPSAMADRLIALGGRVFLDAKMYDTGEAVRQGVARATSSAAFPFH